jgi:hypothetical protein
VELTEQRGRRAWNTELEAEIVSFLESEGIEPYEQSLIGFTKLKRVEIPEELVTYGKQTVKIKVKD